MHPDQECFSAPGEIHPIAGAVINAQFADAFSHRLRIANKARRQTLDTHLHARTRSKDAQSVQPMRERFRIVAYRLLHVKKVGCLPLPQRFDPQITQIFADAFRPQRQNSWRSQKYLP
jgi:hypothetical protein